MTTLFEIIKSTAHTTDQTIVGTIASRILEQYGENVTEAKAINATIEIMEELGLRTAEVGDKVKMGGTTYTIAKIHYAQLFQSSYKPCSDDGWMIEFIDTNGGYHYWKQYLDGGEFIKATADNNTTTNNEEEETTMKTTFTLLNGTTYTMNPQTNRYAKTADGKTTRIGKAEYEAAKHEYDLEQEVENLELHPVDEQAELDKEPCRVEVEDDLEKPAVLNENGCVDCRECNVKECVHRNCMRRNPRNVGGLGECPRLDVIPQPEDADPNDPENAYPDEMQDPELEQIMNETGLEASDAELERNIRNEQKKTTRKPRRSKDIAYEGHGKTLTAKQVDFILHLSDTCFWENGLESTPWIDVLCDEIGGQFANKPMTVGAMVSTLCEKGLGYRATDSLTDMVTGRSHKATYFALTDLGKEIAKELGLE